MPSADSMRAPTEAEIDAAETRLSRKFHPEYRAYLRGGGDIAGAKFVEDNGDYFCIADCGEVVYWSHNGSTDERWPSLTEWHRQVCLERK